MKYKIILYYLFLFFICGSTLIGLTLAGINANVPNSPEEKPVTETHTPTPEEIIIHTAVPIGTVTEISAKKRLEQQLNEDNQKEDRKEIQIKQAQIPESTKKEVKQITSLSAVTDEKGNVKTPWGKKRVRVELIG